MLKRTVLGFLFMTLAAPSAAIEANVVKSLGMAKSSDFAAEFNALSKVQKAIVLQTLRIDVRIVGGRSVEIKDFPWQVALVRGYAPEPMRSQFCGGTLIAPAIVVTAAHCIDNSVVRKDATRVDVIDGTAFYPAGGERIKVTALFVHPQWDAKTNDFDVAILKLERAAAAGIPIAFDDQPVADGAFGEVSGWGTLFEGGNGSPDLLAARIPVISNAVCNQPESYDHAITDRMICAGLREGGVDSCQGDSGGPFVSEGATRKLIGVVSFGEGCARKLKYGVYTRVSAVAPWIKSIAGIQLVTATPLGRNRGGAVRTA